MNSVESHLVCVVVEGMHALSVAGVPHLHRLVGGTANRRVIRNLDANLVCVCVWGGGARLAIWKWFALKRQFEHETPCHPHHTTRSFSVPQRLAHQETKCVLSGLKATFKTQEPCPDKVPAKLACCLETSEFAVSNFPCRACALKQIDTGVNRHSGLILDVHQESVPIETKWKFDAVA